MSFGYDPEAVIQDADIEMAQYEAEARRLRRLESQGICTHQGVQGRGDGKGPLPGGLYRESQRDIPKGHLKCHGCGTLFESDEAWFAASEIARRAV